MDAIRKQLDTVVAPFVISIQEQAADAVRRAAASIEWPPFNFTLPPGLSETIRNFWDRHIPPNWPADVELEAVVDVVRQDELPLVWVPRSDIVAAVVEAADRPARVEVLLAHQDEVLDDCDEVLDSIEVPRRDGDLLLARQAVHALREDHHEAAQALAAAALETTLSAQITKTSTVRGRVRVNDIDDVQLFQLRLRVALAPLETYFRSFEPGKAPEDQYPLGPNGHITVHVASPEHLNPGNALVSVMLLVSVLRALQDLVVPRAHGADTSWLTGQSRS